jgi:transposase
VWRRLDERIEHVTEEIEELAHGTEGCRQLMTVPGIGPIIASAMVAAIGGGTAFARGRDFAAWLGLVPKQMSTGDRTILGHHFGKSMPSGGHPLHQLAASFF